MKAAVFLLCLSGTDARLSGSSSRHLQAAVECEDVESFIDFRGRERDCDWVGQHWGRCWKYGTEFCPVTCEMECATPAPTLPPTPPTTSPTTSPTGWCADVNAFLDEHDKERTCEWVKRKRRCNKYGAEFCPESCEMPCATPSPTGDWGSYGAPTVAPTLAPPPTTEPECQDVISFTDHFGKERTCEWVATKNEKARDKGRTCKKYGAEFCPETCDVPCATPSPTVFFDPDGECTEEPFFEHEGKWRSCWWVNKIEGRCQELGAFCPITCELCEPETTPTPAPPTPPEDGECLDTEGVFVLNGRLRTCEWVGGGAGDKRCRKFGGKCPATCLRCDKDE